MKSAKNLYSLELGVRLWLGSWGMSGFFADFLAPIGVWFLGDLIDKGIYAIDIMADKITEAMKKADFKKLAQKAHDKAILKKYTEEEKDAIRKEYLDILGKFVAFANGVQHSGKNSKHKVL